MTIFAQAKFTSQKMKRLFLILLLFAAVSLHAQHKPFQFGFQGGVNLGWFKTDIDNYNNEGAQFGGSWGFVADIFLMENYSFTTGFNVLYLNAENSTGVEHFFPEDSAYHAATLYQKINSKYIQIPVIFTMKTNNIKDKLRIYGQIGYGLGILLQAKQDYKFEADDGSHSEEHNGGTFDGFTSTRSSLIIGLGVEIPLHKSTYIRTGLKFDNCFVDIYKSEDYKVRSNFIELKAAVIF